MRIFRLTVSARPCQRKDQTRRSNEASTHLGTAKVLARCQNKLAARTLITRARPMKESARLFQKLRTFSSFPRLGDQFSFSRLPWPKKPPKMRILLTHFKLSEVSNLWRHRLSQMASVLVLFNFAPVAFSYLAIMSKRLFSDKMSFAKQVVSSAYWETLN